MEAMRAIVHSYFQKAGTGSLPHQLPANELDPIFAAAALFIFRGTTATPSSLAAAFDSTIN